MSHRIQVPDLLCGNSATVIYAHNVLDPMDRSVFRCANGRTLQDLRPQTSLPTICNLNGEYIHPDDWSLIEVTEDDVISFVQMPLGGGGGGGSAQTVLGIVAIVAGSTIPGFQALIGVGAALLVGGLMPQPNYTPITTPNGSSDSPSPTYTLQLSGNGARIGQAMPVPYGRHIISPDFASQPYTRFDDSDNQYYFALFSIGVMERFSVESVMIDDTELSHFVDVETQYVGPQFATPLSLVNPAVVTAPEVASQELVYGTYVGPFAACGPGLKATKIEIDVVMPRGLYYANDAGALESKTCSWMAEARPINDFGSVVGDWFLLGIEELSLAQNSQVRRTFSYDVPANRYEVRVQRLEAKDTNARTAHEINWAGMRSFLSITPEFDAGANFLAVKMKASNQLSGLSQRKFALIIRRHLKSWNPTTGWSDYAESRSIAWALADILRNTVYGGQMPDNRIDLQTLYELDQIWEARGDYFNAIFDKRVTIWSALTTVARCGRARPVMRGSVFTFVRDQLQSLPSALFNMRNIKRGSFSISYNLVTEDTADGLELEFFDQDTWSSKFVTMAIPGISGDPVNPAKASIVGISNLYQAQRECAYMVADAAYRPAVITFTTEMDGYLPAFGDLIAVAHDVAGWGVSGELESWDGTTGITTEELQWSVGANYMILVDEFGDVHGPYEVVPDTMARSFKFATGISLTFTPNTGFESDRTRYAMGPASSFAKMCRVLELRPGANDEVQIRAIVEDTRVHSADLPYQEGPQPPEGSSGGGGGGGSGSRLARYAPDGTASYDAASDATRVAYGFYASPAATVGSGSDAPYIYGL